MLVSSFPMIDLFLQFLLALVFAGAAVSKLQNADEFHGVVRNFRLLPQAVDGAFAAALPVHARCTMPARATLGDGYCLPDQALGRPEMCDV